MRILTEGILARSANARIAPAYVGGRLFRKSSMQEPGQTPTPAAIACGWRRLRMLCGCFTVRSRGFALPCLVRYPR
jgi:hypothetical protein